MRTFSSGLMSICPFPSISRSDFQNCEIRRELDRLRAQYHVPDHALCVEVTERDFCDDVSVLKDQIKDLRDHGYEVWMDDFGSGYSSLNVLKDIDIDVLKIDMRFLSKGSSEERGEKILEAVIKMAKSLDMLVIAEGVEEEKQVKMLKRLGCDYIQGYYFAKPMPKKDYVKLLQKSR